MKLIVGLGNPGEKYRKNRHNVGFMFVDYIVSSLPNLPAFSFSKNCNAEYTWTSINNERVEFFKPQTYMNNSGKSVSYAVKKHSDLKIENLIVVHDDLDIPFGKFKIQLGNGPKLHNGIESIENHLHAKDFWRIRIGVDNRTNPDGSRQQIDGETYVLQDFKEDEKKLLIEEIFPKLYKRLAEQLDFHKK